MDYTYDSYKEGLEKYKLYLAESHGWNQQDIDTHLRDNEETLRNVLNEGWPLHEIFYFFE